MDSSSDEEIRKWKENIKDLQRKIEQRKRKKREERSNSLSHIRQSEDSFCSSKTTDFTTEDTPEGQIKVLEENQYSKDAIEKSMHPKKGGRIDEETTNKTFFEKSFQKKPGTTDKGRKYEVMIMTHIILQMVSDSKIKNFYVSSNDASFGDFDDVVIEVETDRGTHTKAIQLKHSTRGRLIIIDQLAKKNGDFSITKYFNSTKNIQDKAQQFILFTKNKFNISNKTKLKLEGEEFYIELKQVSASENSDEVLGISKNINYCYKFEIIEDQWTKANLEKIQQYQSFFERFRLYTNQERLESLTTSTMGIFTKMFCCNEEIFNAYFKFISEWSMEERKKEKLSKKFTQRLIALRLLSPHIEPFAFGPITDEMRILRDAIDQFDITLLKKKASNEVKKLWGDLNKNIDLKELNKVRSRYSISSVYISTVENLDDNVLSQLLWLMDKSPLIVKDHKNIEKAVQLCRDAKFVLLGEGKSRQWMDDRSVFQNLSHLESKLELHEKVLQNFTISLQGKAAFNLKIAFEQNQEILKHVTVNKLLEMSNGACCIDGPKEIFPNLYIERYLSLNIIDIKYLENVNQSTVIILTCEENFDELKISEKYISIDINDFFSATISELSKTPIIITSKSKCSEFEFQKVCSKTPDFKVVHYFNFLSNTNLEWVRSRGDVSELRNYKLSNFSENEKELWRVEFSNNVNIITGDPGMGKTELTKSLKNNCCPKYWTVIMIPQDVNLFVKTLENCEISDYVKRFESFILHKKYQHLDQLDHEFFKMCLKRNNIVYVWDALDEVLTKNLDPTSILILLLSQQNFAQWVTSRQHLNSFFEKKFNVLPMSINQFSELEQESYIRKRLSSFISSDDMKITIEKIKSTFAFTKHIDILGIPLQIFLLTEIFLQNKDTYLELLNDKFLLTDLYRYFIDGKFTFFFEGKVPVMGDYWKAEVRRKKEEKIKQYEKFAFQIIFPDEVLKQLKIDCPQNVDLLSEECATVGIITAFQNGVPHFVHASFAEYFVALYFSKKFEKIRRDIFFDRKYSNVRFFFDMLVGKKSPVHIAILYRNFEELKSYNDEIINRKDDCGRSALHLICSWGQRHPRLKVQKRSDGYVIKDDYEGFRDFFETGEYLLAIRFLLKKCEVSDEDSLFKITPLAYCRTSESLGAELELLQSRKLQFQRSYRKSDRINILYYSAQLGYDKTIKKVVSKNFRSCYDEVNFAGLYSDETPLLAASRFGYPTIVEYLVECGAETNYAGEYGRTPLCIASTMGHHRIVECLVKNGAEMNRADVFDVTPLYGASSNGHEKIVECLLKFGAEVNNAHLFNRIPLYEASSKGHEKIVECLVKYGAEINRTNNNEQTPLFIASSNGHEKIVECLVKNGAEINRADDIYGNTPLYVASSNGHEGVVECLVKCGADINRSNNYDETPLFAASSNGHEKIVECLVKNGAEINHADIHGWTPLYAASSNGHEKIVEASTPLSAACKDQRMGIVEFLVANGATL